MNIQEVARRAKVSTATVSRIINHNPTVDPRLAKRVLKIIDQSGYRPNIQARSLVSGRSHILGLVVSEITNPFFPEIVHAFERMAVDNGYEILLVSTVHDPKRMDVSVRRMTERRVDGVAVMTFGMEELLVEDPVFKNVPLVFVDVGPDRPRVTNIRIDYQNGIRQAVQHLAALKHERIAFISGPRDNKSAATRQRAFEQSMREIELTADEKLIIEGDHTLEGGAKAMRTLLSRRQRPTAVVCSNDMTALGVMRTCYEKSLSIPKDLSVIGFDDIKFAQFVLPPLTTIRMSQTDLAGIAFRALLAELERAKPSEHGTEYLLETTLVLRDSTAIAPNGASGR
jgi:LacI family transcriptional regulator